MYKFSSIITFKLQSKFNIFGYSYFIILPTASYIGGLEENTTEGCGDGPGERSIITVKGHDSGMYIFVWM